VRENDIFPVQRKRLFAGLDGSLGMAANKAPVMLLVNVRIAIFLRFDKHSRLESKSFKLANYTIP